MRLCAAELLKSVSVRHVFLKCDNAVADNPAGRAEEAGQLKPADRCDAADGVGRRSWLNGDSVFVVAVVIAWIKNCFRFEKTGDSYERSISKYSYERSKD